MEKAVKKYRQRRSARLGIETIKHYDSVEDYRARREARLHDRMDADEEGEWRTTDNGHKILIKDGVVVGGNPFTVVGMGAPDKVDMPKTSKTLKERDPFEGIKDFTGFADALKGRKQKDCIFGGFYKVAQTGGSLPGATFYNPYTGEHFSRTLKDKEMDISPDNNEVNDILDEITINKDALWCWNRSNGVVQEGDTIRVVKGRTLDHGTEAKVRAVHKMTFSGKTVTYAYLDNGEKINVNNVDVVEDGKTLRSKESKEADELKASHKEYRDKRKEKEREKKISEVRKEEVEKTVGSAKTRKTVVDALKKAGYKIQDETDNSSSTVDVRVMRPDGTYVRIYKVGKELKFQNWGKVEEEKLKSDASIRDAKYYTQMFANRHKSDKTLKFKDLESHEKYWFVLAKSVNFFKRQGMDDKKAWSRAIDNADSWDSKDYEGYEEAGKSDEIGKEVLGSIIDGLKK